MVRYLALGVLVAGLAAIVWTAVRGDGSGDDPAADSVTAVADATDSVDGAPEPADPVTEVPIATES